MKFTNTEVFNFEGALRGLRNPMNSWEKSDSYYGCDGDVCITCKYSDDCGNVKYTLGENDLKLAQTLIKAGTEHCKFMRQIMISVDITAPLYWWKEFDTYKVGTTANSTSTMHKLSTTPITLDCFEIDDYEAHLEVDFMVFDDECFNLIPVKDVDLHNEVFNHVSFLEALRTKYLETKDIKYWKELIRWLPESWLQTRTITMNYENVRNMYWQRRNHKLSEWSKSFIGWIESLPYAKGLIMLDTN